MKEILTIIVVQTELSISHFLTIQATLAHSRCVPSNIHGNFARLVASKEGISSKVWIVILYTTIRPFRDDVRMWYDDIMADGLSFRPVFFSGELDKTVEEVIYRSCDDVYNLK